MISPTDSNGSGSKSDVNGQAAQNETELGSKMLQIQSKRFYIDVKQNRRGRFVKVAEIAADGRRTQVYLALSTAAEFRDHLSAFSEFYSGLGPPSTDNCPEDGKLKSEMMVKDNRRYYLDLKENTRGRFLRVSQTIPRGGPRSQVAIPAQGLIEFRDALTDLLDEFGSDDGGFKGELPEGKHMRVENKNFYFDIGQNDRGIYMRISEVKTNFRTSVTVPEKSWSRFRDIFGEYVEKMAAAEAAAADVAGSASSGAATASSGAATASSGAATASSSTAATSAATSNGAVAAAGTAVTSASVSHGAVAATSLGLAPPPVAATSVSAAPSIEQTTGDPDVDQLATSN